MAKIEFTSDELSLITRALSDSMNYKPDDKWTEKWALLLRCKQLDLKNQEKRRLEEDNQKEAEQRSIFERCPWYETVRRIFLILGMVALLYGFFFGLLIFVLMLFNDTLGWWDWACATAQGNPVLAIVLFAVAFVALLFWFIYLVGKRLVGE